MGISWWKVEENESIESAVIREIKEETGLDVALSHSNQGKSCICHFKITLHVYMCDYQSGTPTALSSMAVQWVTLNEMKDYAFPSANKRIISALEKAWYNRLYERIKIYLEKRSTY